VLARQAKPDRLAKEMELCGVCGMNESRAGRRSLPACAGRESSHCSRPLTDSGSPAAGAACHRSTEPAAGRSSTTDSNCDGSRNQTAETKTKRQSGRGGIVWRTLSLHQLVVRP